MQNTKTSESGRTMVEVLGVVAIIGVLSVGGMALSEHIIDRIKANRIVSGLQERIVLAMKRRTIGKSNTFRDRQIQESILGLYPVSYEKSFSDNTIPIYFGKKITVSGLSQEVCEALKEDEILLGTLNEINGVVSFNDGGEDGACEEENNEFFILFGGRNEGKCYGRGNKCLECDETTGDWVVDESMNGRQVQDSCHICSDGRIVAKDKGRIKPCGSNCCSVFETCSSDLECVTHCPANSSVDYVAGNQIGDSDCYCNEDYRVDAFQTGCRSERICEEPCDVSRECDDGQCVCKNGKVLAYDPTVGGFNFPKKCCSTDKVMNGICYGQVKVVDEEKLYCPLSGGFCCPENSFYSTYDNTCYSCDEPGDIRMLNSNNSAYCRVCPNRVALEAFCRTECPNPEMILVDQYCTCPLEKPYLNTTTNECLGLNELVINKNYSINNRYKKGNNGEWVYDHSKEFECRFLKDNPHYHCGGGGMIKCAEDKISVSGCKTCNKVDLTTIKFQSQCEFCGGTWSGENWFTGTCMSPE